MTHSFKQLPNLPTSWDALLIGSGIGALAAAAILAKHARKRVLVLERHYTPGGYTHAFHRPGYEWDVGVHYIGQVHNTSHNVRRAFDYLTGGQLQWAPMPEVYDRILLNGRTYDFPTGAENFRAQLKRYFPRDTAAIDRYLNAVRDSNRASGLYFTEKALPRPIAALAGPLLRRPYLRWAGRTTLDVLREFTNNEELIGVLTAQWGDYGLPPAQSSFAIHALIAEHYFDGASYPIGGSSRIAETITPVIEAAGGRILASAEVTEILLDKGRAVGVRMADGRELRAPIVISDAGARNTFERLLPAPPPALDKLRAELRAVPPSMAHLSLYVGLKHTAAELGLSGTNLWIHPTANHDANLQRFSADPNAPFPVLFISFPSAKDPDFDRRHPGRATLEIVTAAPYDWFARWEDSRWRRRGDGYNDFKQQLAGRLQAELERHVPAVKGKIDYAELSTPLSTRHFMNYERGEAYGLSATPDRFKLRALRPQTPIPGLYLTGQDVVSLGVAGALFGGVIAASAVLGGNMMSVVTAA